VVLAAPVLWETLEGRRAVEDGALRYLVCFGLTRLGVGLVGALYDGYRRQQAAASAGTAERELPGRLSESR